MRISKAFIEHVVSAFPDDDKLADRLRTGKFDPQELNDFFKASAMFAMLELRRPDVPLAQKFKAASRIELALEWEALKQKDVFETLDV